MNNKLVDQSTVDKTKSILDKMIAEKQKNRPVAVSPEINQIFKELLDKRRGNNK